MADFKSGDDKKEVAAQSLKAYQVHCLTSCRISHECYAVLRESKGYQDFLSFEFVLNHTWI